MVLTKPPKSEAPISQASDRRLLLILDLDETLVFASDEVLDYKPNHRVFDYHIYFRPGLMEFLQRVSSLFRLAIWTSSSGDYARAICSLLFEDTSRLEFMWARDRCTRKWDWETQEVTYVKHLSKLRKYGYDLTRTLIVDDSPEKHTKNYGNLIRVSSFEGIALDDELRWLAHYLKDISTVNNVRMVEKRGWRSRYDMQIDSSDHGE
jgi:RNA polymerase II subunit A small phosphatase-like protein